ncbi:helix-turn-helix transcriptional regulator [Seohaeicola zhoushanensis]|uniref:HTH luxR-type domain-containing protein n=1 Tax=Seohaeicola zhoushanensis TaxID=1569283 RepID=A0A8J3H2N3_9RHOB|nr:LuxR C-terminal-related transcriptional regulator [Seohaeicola zhoushanensis]GHF69134.1 hypothetical protein GCM10017056_45330 [Seohaeicola zhoushanensis]
MRIVIASQNNLFGELLSQTCSANGISIHAFVGNLGDITQLPADAVVMLHVRAEARLADLGIANFLNRHPGARIIAIANAKAPPDVLAFLRGHVEAVLFDDVSSRVLISLLTIVREGFQVLAGGGGLPNGRPEPPSPIDLDDPELPDAHPEDPPDLDQDQPLHLSGRELEIVELLLKGASNKEIAKRLNIVENTVKVHLRSCYAKIGVRNRTQAALWGSRHLEDFKRRFQEDRRPARYS